jgi:hypothetical protein
MRTPELQINGRRTDERDKAMAEANKLPGKDQVINGRRLRCLKSWLVDQPVEHEIRQFKIVGTGIAKGKCLEGWKNLHTGKTHVTKIRQATFEESITHGIKKWGRKYGNSIKES